MLNVNPFFSLHLNKDETGEKVIHPSINLHITPNEHILTKFLDKKHHVKKIILHKKLQSFSNPSLHPFPPAIYSQSQFSHYAPEEIFYPQPLPYDTHSLINPEPLPVTSTNPGFYSQPGFNPLYDSPPSFINSHYRNINSHNISNREDKHSENKNIVFPNNRKKRTISNLENMTSQHSPRNRVSLCLFDVELQEF